MSCITAHHDIYQCYKIWILNDIHSVYYLIVKGNANKLNSEIKNAGLRLWMKEFIQDLNLDVHDLNMRAFQ